MAPSDAAAGGSRAYGRDESVSDQPVELRRHLDALRRWRLPIALMILAITGTTLALSLVLPKHYRATAKVLFDPTQNPAGPQDSESVKRELATIGSLITAPKVLRPVAARYDLGYRQLKKKIASSVDTEANLVSVSADDGKRKRAVALANDVARSFIDRQAATDRRAIRGARARVLQRIGELGAVPDTDLELQALRTRLIELTVAFANAGSEVRLAEAAQEPENPTSPRPVYNTVLAFLAASLLAVLIAVAREQLVPRISGARELSRITDRPVLATIPFVRRRFRRASHVLQGAEYEAYQTLQATIRFQLPPEEQHIILITSAVEGEGKTSVTVNLGRALARAGHKTLVVSADMRRPQLHELAGVPPAPGLSEVLQRLEQNGDSKQASTVAALERLLGSTAGARGNLHVLPAGTPPEDPAQLLLSAALPALFERLRAMDYHYILLDGPPLLGIADAQVLAQRVDDVVIVSRLDRVTVDQVVEVQDLLDRLEVNPVGHVVIGVRRSSTYYYPTTRSERQRVRA